MTQSDWQSMMQYGGQGLGSLLGMENYQNPGDSANQYLSQIGSNAQQNLSPYMQYGGMAMPQLMQQYGNLMNNPTGMMNQMYGNYQTPVGISNAIQSNWQDPTNTMNKIGSTYQSSPGYQFNVQQATNAVNNAAAAGGMAGSPQEQQQMAGTVSGLANQDYSQYMGNALGQYNNSVNRNMGQFNNYMNQGMGMYGMGLQGMQGMGQMGLNASSDYSKMLSDALMSQANAAYAGTQAQNQSQGQGFGGMLGALGGIASSIPW